LKQLKWIVYAHRNYEQERRDFSLGIEKHGTPTAVLMNIRDYVKLAAPDR
jgi:hypothetical protein